MIIKLIKYKIIRKIILYWKLRLENLYTNKAVITEIRIYKKFFNYVECQYSKFFILSRQAKDSSSKTIL
jgi:hypothetical protein